MKKYKTQPLIYDDPTLLESGKEANNPLRDAFDKINDYSESLKSEISYLTKSNTTLQESQNTLLQENQDMKERVTFLESKNKLLETQLSRLYYILYKREVPDITNDNFEELEQEEVSISQKKKGDIVKNSTPLTVKKEQPVKATTPNKSKSSSLDLYEKLSKLDSKETKKEGKVSTQLKSLVVETSALPIIETLHLDDYEFPITYSNHLDSVRFFEKIKDGLFVTSGDDGRIVVYYKERIASGPVMSRPVSSMAFIKEEGCLLLFGIDGCTAVVRFAEASVPNKDKKPMFSSSGKNKTKVVMEDLDIEITTMKLTNSNNEGNIFSQIVTETHIFLFSSSFKYCKLQKNKIISMIGKQEIDFDDITMEWIPLDVHNPEESLIVDLVYIGDDSFIMLTDSNQLSLLKLSEANGTKDISVNYNDKAACPTAIATTGEHLIVADSEYSIHFIAKEKLHSLATGDISPFYTFKNASEFEIETITSIDIQNEEAKAVIAFSTNNGVVRIITLSNKDQERMISFENELSEHETHSKMFREIITNMKLTCSKQNIELWLLGADSNLKMYVF